MATRYTPAYFKVTDYDQAGEDALAATLSGVSDGGKVIYNTTLNKLRIWDGTAFTTGPMKNPDGGTWNAGSGYDGNPATIIQDSTHRFSTDAEKSTWGGKQDALGFTPANAVHTHANQGYAINVQALTSSPTDAQTIYFGTLPKVPVTAQGTSKIYIRSAGTIKKAEIYCYSGTAGTNESWSIYIRLNNSGDTLIATVGASTNERVFSNTNVGLTVAAGDYIEIKSVNPTWATNPLTTIFGGYIYIE
jgi:hypothetical protein